MGATPSLSPLQLSSRVLVKGKVQIGKHKSGNRYPQKVQSDPQKVQSALQLIKSRSTMTAVSRMLSRSTSRSSTKEISSRGVSVSVDDDDPSLSRCCTIDLVFGNETVSSLVRLDDKAFGACPSIHMLGAAPVPG